jgi:hypothetical protein
MQLAYTLGARSVYDSYIEDDPNPMKAKGGSVWRSPEDAELYLEKCHGKVALFDGILVDAGVYPLELPNGWEKDTHRVEGVLWRTLMVDAKLRRREVVPIIIPELNVD